MNNNGPLAGRGVVITRPAGEAQRLVALVREAGGKPLLYPAIEILDAVHPRHLDSVIDRLDDFDLAIFVSPSAVDKAMTRISARRTLPPKLRYAVIGLGGARALQRFGIAEVIVPQDRYDSESLLASSYLQNVRGLRMVIFHAEGGRDLLRETLMARGAEVEYAVCYRRAKPAWAADALLRAWEANRIAAVIVTSSEGLRNFCDLIGAAGQAWLRQTPIVVSHPRIANTAHDLGMLNVVEAQSGDEALMRALVRQTGS